MRSWLDAFDVAFLARARQEGLALEPDRKPTAEALDRVRKLATDVARGMRHA